MKDKQKDQGNLQIGSKSNQSSAHGDRKKETNAKNPTPNQGKQQGDQQRQLATSPQAKAGTDIKNTQERAGSAGRTGSDSKQKENKTGNKNHKE
ncbi:MAG: hypothetical protein SH857_09900 [Chitinophagales bacterium]|nr:hypothetical protein [Chitinophagales bacterium]